MGQERPYGRYILEERIAMGGMAEIFRARTAAAGFSKTVCIKRVLPQYLEDDDFIAMFRDEAMLSARLQHANIVHVFDFGVVDETLFLAMELVDGADLRRLLKLSAKTGNRPTIAQCVQLAIEAARGLGHAHTLEVDGRAMGLVHRDISPHNLLLSKRGEVKVTDFGIAKSENRETHTATGLVKGKLSYMAPEQAEGKALDHRVDQFALGVVLWEMLTGERLFSGPTEVATLRMVVEADVTPPSQVRAAIPKELDEIVLRALAREPNDRFFDMRAFEHALARFMMSFVSDPAESDLSLWVAPLVKLKEKRKKKTKVLSVEQRVAPAGEVESLPGPPLAGPATVAAASRQERTALAGFDEAPTLARGPQHPPLSADAETRTLHASSSVPLAPMNSQVPILAPGARPSPSVEVSQGLMAAPLSDEHTQETGSARPALVPAARRPVALYAVAGGLVFVAGLSAVAWSVSQRTMPSSVQEPQIVRPNADGVASAAEVRGDDAPAPAGVVGNAARARPSVDTAQPTSGESPGPAAEPVAATGLIAAGATSKTVRPEPVPIGSPAPALPPVTVPKRSPPPAQPAAKPMRVATPKPRVRKRSRPKTQGEVFIKVETGWAEVYVRGKKRGETPMLLKLPSGTQYIELRRVNGAKKRVKVTVDANERQVVRVQL